MTYHKKAVPTGWVIFLSAERKGSAAQIGADGSFQTELPAGEYGVGMSASRESDKTVMEAFDEAPQRLNVPDYFSDPQYLDLRVTVEADDENKIELTLTDRRS